MDAAAFGHEEIVRFLLENKADAQLGVVRTHHGDWRQRWRLAGSAVVGTPQGRSDACLSAQNACRKQPSPMQATRICMRCPTLPCTAMRPPQDGDLPAHRAARSGHAAVLRILEQLPGGPEALLAPNADGKTPLMLVSALQEGGAEAAAFLMERGADPCAADKVRGRGGSGCAAHAHTAHAGGLLAACMGCESQATLCVLRRVLHDHA
jgi:hypothetical protein